MNQITERYTIPPELRAWVERTAPTLTLAGWASGDAWAATGFNPTHQHDCGCSRSTEEWRALLAYRDEVARGLSPNLLAVLRWACGPNGCLPAMHISLGAMVKVDLDADVMVATTWGRVIAERAREIGGGR